MKRSVTSLLKTAWILSLFTIGYNLLEGVVATIFGAEDETLVLFGFGIDSFVEVTSGAGIAHMIWRMQHQDINGRDRFEQRALKITGWAFYLLATGLLVGAFINITASANPESTLWGIVVSIISILTMYFLYRQKLKIGIALDSAPIISDANCTKACFYLSFILLGASLFYELFKIPYLDAIGSTGIAWYSFKEGREAFEKSSRLS